MGGCARGEGRHAETKALIAACGRLDEPIRHDMTDQFTSSPLRIAAHYFPGQISRYLPIFSAEFHTESAAAGGGALRNRREGSDVT